MSWGAVLIGLALLILIAAYVSRPLLGSDEAKAAASSVSPREQLLAQRDAIYAAIRELDFDYQTGKVDEQDYQIQRQRHVIDGVRVLKGLDALPQDSEWVRLSAEIEAAVRAMRQRRARGAAVSEARFCPQCGRPVDADARFCAQCGAELASGVDS